jgi:hypothetical protein
MFNVYAVYLEVVGLDLIVDELVLTNIDLPGVVTDPRPAPAWMSDPSDQLDEQDAQRMDAVHAICCQALVQAAGVIINTAYFLEMTNCEVKRLDQDELVRLCDHESDQFFAVLWG